MPNVLVYNLFSRVLKIHITMYSELSGALACGAIWTLSYFFVIWRWKLEPEWSCRLIAAVHGTLVTILGAISCCQGPNPFTEPGGPNTYIQDLTLTVSLGYFIFDTTWCLYYQTEGPTMLLHHFLSLVSMTRRLLNGFSGGEFVAAMFSFEITNPFLQARWFVRSMGHHNTWLYTIVEMVFMAMFFVFRILFSGYLAYTTFIHPRPDWELKIQGLSFYALSWVFWVFIMQYFVAKYVRKSKSKGEKNHVTNGTAGGDVANGLRHGEVTNGFSKND